MSSSISSLVVLAALDDISQEHSSEELNSMTNTMLLNLIRSYLLRRMANEALDLHHDLERRLDES